MREQVYQAFASLDGEGDVSAFRELFAEDAQWLGVPGLDGATPT